MRNLLTILSLASLQAFSQNPCPVKGDSKSPKLQHLDTLKNRTKPGIIDRTVTLEKILAPGNDLSRFKTSQYVQVTGYVILVKPGGSETCNCHSKDADDLDIHIEIAEKPTDNAKDAMIVEINRFTKLQHPEWTVASLKKLIGKKVTVEGWIFSDEEHKQNAVNSNPSGTDLWRRTITEIHPVLKITK